MISARYLRRRRGVDDKSSQQLGKVAQFEMIHAILGPRRASGVAYNIDKHSNHPCNNAARAEATMGRWKQVIGDELRAHTDERRATEVAVAVHALNRMLEFGRPSYLRVA